MRIHELLQRNTPGQSVPPRQNNSPISDAIEENIRAVVEMRRQAELRKTRQDRVADAITRFSGSMPFLYLHAAWFGVWVVVNIGEHPLVGFDPYPFGLLTMIVSLEAIFLATFVLISQNKMGEVADVRADLDLQIDLLSEYEITRMFRLVDAMAAKMGIEEALDPELEQLKKPTNAAAVVDEMVERVRESKEG